MSRPEDPDRPGDPLDIPPELRGDEEARAARAALEGDPRAAAEADAFEADLAALRGAFTDEPSGSFMARLMATAEAERHAARGPAPAPGLWERLRGALSPRWLAPALVVAAVAVFFIGRGPDPDAPVRTKGAGGGPWVTALDLQVSVEPEDPAERIHPASDRMGIGEGDGLLFRIIVEGGGAVALIERDPAHHLKVLSRWDDPRGDEAPRALAVTDAEGDVLRYVPDGPAGEYTYLAAVVEAQGDLDAAALDALWARWAAAMRRPMGSGPEAAAGLDAMRIRLVAEGAPGAPSAPGGAIP